MYKTIVTGLALGALTLAAAAKDDDDQSEVEPVMPESAQSCEMPDQPDPIDADADYDTLVAHQGKIKSLQAGLSGYRECLDDVRAGGAMSEGNVLALNLAHDASVDMEEKAAANFNEAVQSYKNRQQ